MLPVLGRCLGNGVFQMAFLQIIRSSIKVSEISYVHLIAPRF